MKMFELINLSDKLNSLPIGKLTIAQRGALARTIFAMSQVRKPFDEALKEAREKLKPDGFAELQQKSDRTPDEENRLKELLAEYNSSIHEAMQPELEAEVTLTVNKPMTPEELLALGDASPEMTGGDMLYTAGLLGIKLDGDDKM